MMLVDHAIVRLHVARVLVLFGLLGAMLSGCYAGGAASSIDSPAEPTAHSAPDDLYFPPDMMWALLSTTPEFPTRFDSMASAVAGSELVLIGQYVGLERGPSYSLPGEAPTWHAVALIKVEEVLKGVPVLGVDGYLHVEFVISMGDADYPEGLFAEATRSIPKDPALMFLDSWATYYLRAGGAPLPSEYQALDSKEIYRTIGGDGAIRVVAGRMVPPSFVDGWPQDIKEQALDGLLVQIRAVTKS